MGRFPDSTAKRLRHQELLTSLDFEEANERRVRLTEIALDTAARLRNERGETGSTFSFLVSRHIADLGGHPDADPVQLCYYDFVQRNHAYSGGVAIRLEQDDAFHLNFFGRQDCRIESMGAVDYAKVKAAPPARFTDKWQRDGVTAVQGHVYRLHVFDPTDPVDFTLKFKILAMSSNEWVVFEWEPIPQDK
jgi:hypothetical protein